MRLSTVKLFEAIAALVAARDGDTLATFVAEELIESSGLEPVTVQEELELLEKLVVVAHPDSDPARWKLTPVGAAASVNAATFDTVFRR